MATSILTWANAGSLLSRVLVDTVQVYDVGEPVTVGADVTRALTPVGDPIPALVQTTTLQNAVESQVDSTFSIKVARKTQIQAGQAVVVLSCDSEPDLVSKALLVDKVSQNGAALIRKAVASEGSVVNQEGKLAIHV